MTTLISEMTIPKPRREPANGPNASTRLTMPRVEPSESLAAKLLVAQQSLPGEAEAGETDLLIRGLVERLPKPNVAWSLEDRAKWLRTAASVFDLVYKTEDGEQREVSIGYAKRGGERAE
jgi:hypothetical protein